jgi:hypothetical protein
VEGHLCAWGGHSCPPLLILTFRKNSRATKHSVEPSEETEDRKLHSNHAPIFHSQELHEILQKPLPRNLTPDTTRREQNRVFFASNFEANLIQALLGIA